MRILEGGGENVVKYLRSRNSLTCGQILISSLEPLSARSLFLEASTAEMNEMLYWVFLVKVKYILGHRFIWRNFPISQTFSESGPDDASSHSCHIGPVSADVSIMGPSMTHPNMSIITGSGEDRDLRPPISRLNLGGDPIISQWKVHCLYLDFWTMIKIWIIFSIPCCIKLEKLIKFHAVHPQRSICLFLETIQHLLKISG